MCKRQGFTMVELVTVIIILGILAVVAAPMLVSVGGEAVDNGLRQTLSVVRDAIEVYSTNNGGSLPGASDGKSKTFKSDLAPYLRGKFPAGPIGPAKDDRRVNMKSDGNPLSGAVNPARAWRYDFTTGEFIFNFNSISSDSVTNYDDF